MNVDKFTIVSFDEMKGFDRKTGGLVLDMDELSDFSLNQTQETSDITGRGGRVVSRLKKNKSVEGSGTNGFLCGGTLATMLGTEVETGDKYLIRKTDYIVATGSKASTAETAAGTPGMEIGTVYLRDENNAYIVGGKKLTQVASTPKTGEFTYDPTTKLITFFAGDVPDGTEAIVFYDTEVKGAKISNDAEKYSGVLELYIDCTCKNACDEIFHGQFKIRRADFSGEFEISGGSDPTTQAFSFTSLPDTCTGKSDLWDFIVF